MHHAFFLKSDSVCGGGVVFGVRTRLRFASPHFENLPKKNNSCPKYAGNSVEVLLLIALYSINKCTVLIKLFRFINKQKQEHTATRTEGPRA